MNRDQFINENLDKNSAAKVSRVQSGVQTSSEPINATLQERGNRYGDFSEHARITQGIKRCLVSGRSWETMSADKKEALEMIAHKMGRIVNGDPDYADSWHDIVGYAKLAEERCVSAFNSK